LAVQEGLPNIVETEDIIPTLVHLLSSQGTNTAGHLTELLAFISSTHKGQEGLLLFFVDVQPTVF